MAPSLPYVIELLEELIRFKRKLQKQRQKILQLGGEEPNLREKIHRGENKLLKLGESLRSVEHELIGISKALKNQLERTEIESVLLSERINKHEQALKTFRIMWIMIILALLVHIAPNIIF